MCTRVSEAGLSANDNPGRHSFRGRMGRGANPPPQLGHTFLSLVTQSVQKVHSYVQIIAFVACGGRSLSHSSQLGRSSRATVATLLAGYVGTTY